MMFDVEAFARGFVATLIDKDVTAIQPQSFDDRLGFHRVVQMLDDEIQRMRSEGGYDENWYRQVVRLRNSLKPSNNGAFDSFETALRDLQLSLTSAPNAFYEEITFSVSKPYAHSIFCDMPRSQQALVAKAVEAFLSARKGHTQEIRTNDSSSSSEPSEQVVSR